MTKDETIQAFLACTSKGDNKCKDCPLLKILGCAGVLLHSMRELYDQANGGAEE